MSSSLRFTGDRDADDLLNNNFLALFIGMLLDQQFPIERAFLAPHRLQQRLDFELEATALAKFSVEDLIQFFSEKPALHRFPKSMAERTHALCNYLVEHYNGNPGEVWTNISDASELRKRLLALPGFGEKKVQIFVALLAKRFGVTPRGWKDVAGHYADSGFHSVADLDSPEALSKLRTQRAEARKSK
ncbi:MAG: HhH-GPD-type base excision DNA repair protein [Acidimicrobiales bacterium]|jgi:uncharacterized HhH-GPD family protein|nr:HhH-GPD-type base excision DNA repair protein [Acidimicrobiales bacterium]MDP6900903.1 HhH-GPD-type base excision DNA repair protein [Acidimicrobiales bacterium]HJL98397.1 HhH-GPD-type base excision DNA repair protein [Acidimicrobiales bacterium]